MITACQRDAYLLEGVSGSFGPRRGDRLPRLARRLNPVRRGRRPAVGPGDDQRDPGLVGRLDPGGPAAPPRRRDPHRPGPGGPGLGPAVRPHAAAHRPAPADRDRPGPVRLADHELPPARGNRRNLRHRARRRAGSRAPRRAAGRGERHHPGGPPGDHPPGGRPRPRGPLPRPAGGTHRPGAAGGDRRDQRQHLRRPTSAPPPSSRPWPCSAPSGSAAARGCRSWSAGGC